MQTKLSASDLGAAAIRNPSWLLVAAAVLLHALSLFPSREGFTLFGVNILVVVALRWLARKGH